MDPLTLTLGAVGIAGAMYVAGHYHGAIITGAKAAQSKISSIEHTVSTALESTEETLAADAESALLKLADKSPNQARIAKEQEAMARKDRLLAAIKAKLPS